MTIVKNRNCPLSDEFLFWPPEEIAQYKNWCEVSNLHHKRRLKKVIRDDKSINSANSDNRFSNLI